MPNFQLFLICLLVAAQFSIGFLLFYRGLGILIEHVANNKAATKENYQ